MLRRSIEATNAIGRRRRWTCGSRDWRSLRRHDLRVVPVLDELAISDAERIKTVGLVEVAGWQRRVLHVDLAHQGHQVTFSHHDLEGIASRRAGSCLGLARQRLAKSRLEFLVVGLTLLGRALPEGW